MQTTDLDPRLTHALASVRRRVKRTALLHGLGAWLALASALLVGSFYLDRILNPPHAMRLVVAPAVWASLAGSFAWLVVRRARVHLTVDDAAILVERCHPHLKERLVTAVQLARDPGGADPRLVEMTIREGEEAALHVELGPVVKGAASGWLFTGGLAAAGLTAALAFNQSRDAAVFLERLAGFKTEFPQRTRLDLDVPARGTNVRVQRNGDVLTVRVARGSDFTVRAIAEGVAPPLVELVTDEGRRIPMGQTGPAEYVARFHAVKEDFRFHAEGGDDRDGLPRVVVETVIPPSVTKIRVKVTPPAYSGQPPFEHDGGSIEALAGSRAEIFVETNVPVRVAKLRYRGTEEGVEFRSGEYREDAPLPLTTKLAAEITVEKNARYSVELEDDEGLRNPDPGSYSIVALTDRAPEVKLQCPTRTEVDLAPGGSLAIQARATDDFGVVSMQLKLRADSRSAFTARELPLTMASGELLESAPASGARGTRTAVARARIDVPSLRVAVVRADGAPSGEERPPAERDIVEFFVEAQDTRAPKPGTGETLHVRAIVLSPSEILKRITERLSRARDTVQSLLDIQLERKKRVAELIAALSAGDAAAPAGGAARQGVHRSSLTSILVGQNRVTTDSRVLTREFFESVESAASNRLDRTGEAVAAALDSLRISTPAAAEDPYSPEVAKALVERIRSGTLGSPEFLGKLAEMLHESARIATEHAPGAALGLDAAMLAFDTRPTLEALERTLALQDAAIQSLERLLGMLAEWSNFQDVITLTKEILDQQKTLEARTKEAATGRPKEQK